jgi:Uma2 family endonuclease
MRLISAEDLWQMRGGDRRELVNGRLVSLPFLEFEHGVVTNAIATSLHQHAREKRLGEVVATGTGFILARNPDTIRGVDVAFVSNVRLPKGLRPLGYFPGPPDLAVEVVSPNDMLAEVEGKVDDYLTAGAKLVWIVNPWRKTVTVHRPQTQPTMLREADTLTGEDVVPDFRCTVAEIFA